MKKILALLLGVVTLCTLFACTKTPPEGSAAPPVRMAKNQIHSSWCDFSPGFPEIREETYAIAIVTVGNWLTESIKDTTTYYEATVEECFKGELPEKIIISRHGSSEENHASPLYIKGDRLLVLLNFPEKQEYENHYRVHVGRECDIVTLDGVDYAVDRFRHSFTSFPLENLVETQPEIAKAVRTALETHDPFRLEFYKEDALIYDFIYRLDDLRPILKGEPPLRAFSYPTPTVGGVEEFVKTARRNGIFNSKELQGFPEDSVRNVTPPTLDFTGIQVFYRNIPDATFLLWNDRVYLFSKGNSNDLISAFPYDYDGNGTLDILYTKRHYDDYDPTGNIPLVCDVAVFDLTTGKSTVLWNTRNSDAPQMALTLVPDANWDFTVWAADTDGDSKYPAVGVCPLFQVGILRNEDGALVYRTIEY